MLGMFLLILSNSLSCLLSFVCFLELSARITKYAGRIWDVMCLYLLSIYRCGYLKIDIYIYLCAHVCVHVHIDICSNNLYTIIWMALQRNASTLQYFIRSHFLCFSFLFIWLCRTSMTFDDVHSLIRLPMYADAKIKCEITEETDKQINKQRRKKDPHKMDIHVCLQFNRRKKWPKCNKNARNTTQGNIMQLYALH